MSAIKLYLISGFLGSGKTTFLKRVLEATKSMRVGVIVNEFGAISIDGKEIQSGDVELVELNNGSIFCACMKDKFVATLQAFSKQPIDILLIENSGLADPGGFHHMLKGLAPYLVRPLDYVGSACLIDCETFLDYFYTLQPVKNQMGTADILILNKLDLADDEDLNEIRECIAQNNPDAKTLDATFADVPMDEFLSDLVNLKRDAICSNTPWNRPFSCVLEIEQVQNETGLLAFVSKMGHYTTRLKGYVWGDRGLLHADCVGAQISLKQAREGDYDGFGNGKLVVIGRDNTDLIDIVQSHWDENCIGKIRIQAE